MSRPTGPTNPIMKKVIEEIKSRGYKEKIPFLVTLAKKLEKPRRKRIEVNLSKINRVCKENEIIVVPGKVLSTGELKKPLTIAAASFSMAALEKIKKAGGRVLTITELIKENPKGKGVRIIT
jgi:large subunit ribosomal protein L18e